MPVENNPVGVANLTGAIELGKQVLKSLELINGGAVIAILTFYGNAVKDGSRVPIDPSLLSSGLNWFAGGLVLSMAAACCAYLGQLSETTSEREAGRKLGIAVRGIAIVLAVLSVAAFARGTWWTSQSLQPPSGDQTRWHVVSHVGSEWTFARRAFEETAARRIVTVCSGIQSQGQGLVKGEDTCLLTVGSGLVEPFQRLAHPGTATGKLPLIDVVDADTLSVTEDEPTGRVTQLFLIKRDEVAP